MRQTLTVQYVLSFSEEIGKDLTKELQLLCSKVNLHARLTGSFWGRYRSALSNTKLKLKTHSGGHNCILPRYRLLDVMSDPVAIALAAETIDPAVMVVGKGTAVFSLLLLRLLLLHLSEESFNEL